MTPGDVWSALDFEGVDSAGTTHFRTGPRANAPGGIRWAVRHDDASAHAGAAQVLHQVPGRTRSLRRLGEPFHPALTTWTVNASPQGTVLTYDHECATSHAAMYDHVTTALDLVERRLRER